MTASLLRLRDDHMDRNIYLIIYSRVFLSFAYGYMNVLISLYLYSLGYSFLFVGIIIGIGMLVNAGLALILGMFADHYGRKTTLLFLFAAFGISSFLFLRLHDPYILSLLAGIGGFTGSGGGPIGSGGPFGSIQTALISEVSKPDQLSRILSTASIAGMVANMAGSFIIYPVEGAHLFVYNLFYLSAFLSIFTVLFTFFTRDMKVRSKNFLPRVSFKNIVKLSLPAIPSGFGGGFVTPMLSLWFKVRFGISAGEIGIVFTFINLATIIAMFFIPFLVPRFGELNMIIGTRAISSIFLIAAAVSPIFILSSFLLALRAAASMGAVPVRQSFALKTVDSTERAATSGATSLTRVGSSSPGPVIGGYLMQTSLELPFVVGGIVSLFDPLLYYILFKYRRNNR